LLTTLPLHQATPESAHSPASALDSVALLVEHLFALLDKDRAPFSLRAKQHAAFCARLLRLLHEKVREGASVRNQQPKNDSTSNLHLFSSSVAHPKKNQSQNNDYIFYPHSSRSLLTRVIFLLISYFLLHLFFSSSQSIFPTFFRPPPQDPELYHLLVRISLVPDQHLPALGAVTAVIDFNVLVAAMLRCALSDLLL
jgi:hypothetical protein